MKYLIAMLAVLMCSLSPALASESTKTLDRTPLSEAQLDNETAGLFDVNISIAPFINTQVAVVETTQVAVAFGNVVQSANSAAENIVHLFGQIPVLR